MGGYACTLKSHTCLALFVGRLNSSLTCGVHMCALSRLKSNFTLTIVQRVSRRINVRGFGRLSTYTIDIIPYGTGLAAHRVI